MTTKTGATTGMAESYNLNSLPQREIIESSTSLIEKGIENLDISPGKSSIMVADFGSSHGSNSMHVIKFIIDYIQKSKKTDRHFLTVHIDLPTNDWEAFFGTLDKKDKKFFSLVIGQSFYKQCLPPNSLTVGYSSASLHWLSQIPCHISNHCISVFAKGHELEAFKKQARDDYQHFLENRSRELIQGGILILVMNCTNDEGKTMTESVYDLLYQTAQSILSPDELLHYTLPVYIRSRDECVDKKLFNQYSFQLIHSNISTVDFKFYEQLKNNTINKEEFAEAQTKFIRCATDSVLRGVLESTENRSKENIDQLSNEFWNMYYKGVYENEDNFDIGCCQAYVVLKKV
ncbi:unnamed protein product [Adineta steineri]|uniref:S-adenosylmethionine-dependent methyltransferase At5g38100 n=1 Tax=Adineta steineri TaxID=433720 RepID=A0A819H965_9BILA|nr:unnamed protein product [Adineta steineri]CAF0866841.1 unnamed protein product [Adineta steineri]CAF3894792.1 unnamed protein product [Adineta steineri]CAF4013137.1 unnamed protein product [Adineta steineri]